jgi:hypothetical protein
MVFIVSLTTLLSKSTWALKIFWKFKQLKKFKDMGPEPECCTLCGTKKKV